MDASLSSVANVTDLKARRISEPTPVASVALRILQETQNAPADHEKEKLRASVA
jgi:hypothetical protein